MKCLKVALALAFVVSCGKEESGKKAEAKNAAIDIP